jgi:glycosyltransferase involved in cell wall biosynthesis
VSVSNLITNVAKQIAPTHSCIRTIPCGAPLSKNIIQYPKDGHLKILYAGRIEEKQKQISLLTKAFCNAAKIIPGIEFSIYGSGSAEREVLEILKTKAVGLPVKFYGKLDSSEVLHKFSLYHVFVLLSDYEGLPISLMESMGVGLVPICTNIRSGISELIDNGKNGILVNNREEDFINAINFLKDNPDSFNAMSLAARKKIELEYSEEICNNLWVELLYELSSQAGEKKKIVFPNYKELKPYLLQKYYQSFNSLRPKRILIPLYKMKYFLGRVKRRIYK